MSEPVSNAEIEDVLSSIRRLVSNDVEATHKESTPAPEKAQPAGKLILTADFRVAEPQNNDAENRDAQADQENMTEEAPQEEAAQEETTDESVAEVVAEAPYEFHHTEAVSEADPEPAADESNEIWQDSADQAIETSEEAAPSLENTIADLEAAIGQQQGEWEPDGSDFEEDADAQEVMSEPVQDWIDGTAQEVEAEAISGEADEQTADAKDEVNANEAGLFGDEESVIDEETLRDMVSDIVRQELQGALGERITRNVRKLVRREINRVLASQDFE
jgi:cell pole-organizing protein PopZ